MSSSSTSDLADRQAIWPPVLAPGDLLAVVAPASPVDPAIFAAGAAILQDWGFRLAHGPEIFAPRPYRTEADQEILGFLQRALATPAVKGIICARGGYGTLRLLARLDLTPLAADPKYLIGFSDITNLLCLARQQAGVVTFHGPTVAHLGEVTPAAREQFYRLLTAPTTDLVCFQGLAPLSAGVAQGPLIGGNLTTLCSLLGTPYAVPLAGQVLFIEDHNEPPYRLDRLLQQLRLAGALDGVKALILGSFTGCNDISQVWEIFAVLGETLQTPILAGLPVGHQPDNFTLPLGAEVRVDAAAGTVCLTSPPCS